MIYGKLLPIKQPERHVNVQGRLSVHRTPAGFRVFFRFSKNAPLQGTGHHAEQGQHAVQKSALLTFNHDKSTMMPRKSTLNYERRVMNAVQAYNSG